MNPIIGIISRPFVSEESNKVFGAYEEIINAINLSGGISIIILPNNIKEQLNNVDGVIFQGGDDFTDYEIELIKYCYEKNIKTLGICLGMQLMGVCFDGKLIDIGKHKYKNKKYVHEILIKDESTLNNIFKMNRIVVNSRHRSAIINTSLDVIATTIDGSIEAIEASNKDFFVGLQWHPESMITYDIMARKIFDYFIEKCRK